MMVEMYLYLQYRKLNIRGLPLSSAPKIEYIHMFACQVQNLDIPQAQARRHLPRQVPETDAKP